MTPAKRERVREQVISKIHWGERDSVVLKWLRDEHAIGGRQADELLEEAYRIRRQEVRKRAVFLIVFSAIGLIIFAGFMFGQYMGRVIVFGGVTALIYAMGLASLVGLFRGIWRLISGSQFGSVD